MGRDETSDYTKEIAKGSMWSLAGNITFRLISFFYIILVARVIAQDDLGLFYLAVSIITLVSVFSTVGLNAALSRYVPYFEGKLERGKIVPLLKSSYLISGGFSLILMGVLWSSADAIGEIYHNPALPEAIRMLLAVVFLSTIFKINTEYLRGRSDMRAMQINKNLQNLLKLVLTFAFFYIYGASVITLSVAYVCSYLIATLFSFLYVSKSTKDLPPEQVKIQAEQMLWEIIPFGIMLSVMLSIGTVLTAIDSIFLGLFTEPSEATAVIAIYTVATLLAMLTLLFPNSIGNITLPVMSRLYGKNKLGDMRHVTETAQRWSLFITVPVAGILITFSAEMLDAFYGPEYTGGALVMSIFVFAVLLRCIPSMLSLALTSMKIVRLQLKILLGTGLLHVLLDIILIPYFGMVGVGISFLAVSVCMIFLFSHYAKKLLEYSYSKELYKLFAVSALMLILIFLSKPAVAAMLEWFPQGEDFGLGAYVSKVVYLAYIMALTALVFFIFMLLVVLSKCLRKDDVVLIRKTLNKIRIPEAIIQKIEGIASYGIA
jgi:O-antigen/teichoic acid export membrane protein